MAKFRERWSESPVQDTRLDGKSGVTLRLLADAVMPRRVFVDNFYFTGLNVMRCYGGRFGFTFNDREPIELKSGELIVIYPGHYVKIESLEETNRVVYCVFDGPDVEDFFDDLGFFDCARGPTMPRLSAFIDIRRQVDALRALRDETSDRRLAALRLLTAALVSRPDHLTSTWNAPLFQAAYRIHQNLKRGIVRLDPLCSELKVSRSHLHHRFVAAGLPSPSEIIRREQLRLAVRLLRESTLSLVDVMERAGFISQSHFSTFIKRYTGRTPCAIRNGHFSPTAIAS